MIHTITHKLMDHNILSYLCGDVNTVDFRQFTTHLTITIMTSTSY